jgi:hypothetical protein
MFCLLFTNAQTTKAMHLPRAIIHPIEAKFEEHFWIKISRVYALGEREQRTWRFVTTLGYGPDSSRVLRDRYLAWLSSLLGGEHPHSPFGARPACKQPQFAPNRRPSAQPPAKQSDVFASHKKRTDALFVFSRPTFQQRMGNNGGA